MGQSKLSEERSALLVAAQTRKEELAKDRKENEDTPKEDEDEKLQEIKREVELLEKQMGEILEQGRYLPSADDSFNDDREYDRLTDELSRLAKDKDTLTEQLLERIAE